MNFNSAEFLVFLPLVLLLNAALFGRTRARHLMLLVASYAFYMTWNWKYAGLIAGSTLIDYVIGLKLGGAQDPRLRRTLLIVSLCVNLGVLALFKYFNFFVESTDSVLTLLGLDVTLPTHSLLLPVGISFYTFQTLSYTIDVYWRRIAPERDLGRFALFVSFFPQLVAGPIVRASDFLPQLHHAPGALDGSRARVHAGMSRVFRGLFKKIVFADLLASLFVDRVFADPSAHSSLDLLLALYGYAFQIYNDFSGYSDIAIGAAILLGFHIPENFDRPYLSRNVREFWTRWHISLSSWLKDYLYIPLGGNRGGRTARNLMITMGLGGLWHGAGLNFVLWGVFHGALLIASRAADRHASPDAPGWVLFRDRFLTFHLVLFGWLLFRVRDMDHFAEFVGAFTSFSGGSVIHPAAVGLLGLAAFVHFTPRAAADELWKRWAHLPEVAQAAGYALAIVVLCGVSVDAAVFIYFQF
ncbi:Peptidoglycan O-acetyltransferase [Planctomycetes bacterium Pla163]|uniref:Peptidoglycan O-acetyltransferase n=1 Tax=Rohdeia mirabilis TaxID=2528008 RepID=A0A518D484_9BACT|nr:Peptidoglycan O-acetyltransferase [Planctomycetes bacterium Pla163]